MYNFNLNSNEELKEIFENVHIKQEQSEKTTTVALTNKRLLFLDYIDDDANEVLRISRGIDYVKYKEVYYSNQTGVIRADLQKNRIDSMSQQTRVEHKQEPSSQVEQQTNKVFHHIFQML